MKKFAWVLVLFLLMVFLPGCEGNNQPSTSDKTPSATETKTVQSPTASASPPSPTAESPAITPSPASPESPLPSETASLTTNQPSASPLSDSPTPQPEKTFIPTGLYDPRHREVKKALAMEDQTMEQREEIWTLGESVDQMKEVRTALGMYSADNRGEYPPILPKLSPKYLAPAPMKAGKLVYKVNDDYKGYELSLTEHKFANLTIPDGYPRSDEKGKIEIKPGVMNPKSDFEKQRGDGIELFEEAVREFPDLMQLRAESPEKAKEKAKEMKDKMQQAIDMGLTPEVEAKAKEFMTIFEETEKGDNTGKPHKPGIKKKRNK